MTDARATAGSAPLVGRAADCLEAGGVVLLPTDTVFGLAALPDNAAAVARIFTLKDRPGHKNLAVMVSNIEQLEAIGAKVTDQARALIDSPFCPGPLTLAVGLHETGRADWLRGREELAFRMPDDAFLLELIDRTGPLLVTSANRSGMGTLGNAAAAAAQLTGHPDMVIEGRECGAMPSTLVNCCRVPPVIERVGVIPPDALAGYLGS
ncbi:L-threonylcarbamoyladenylate synthase [Puniceibacterium sediminis]|uniref:L-threonylcarbamoyladenylate synthase n=1 Tax=Puniceibacterium sediminis TaxID=1608407 RepID=A0A238YIE4_9RHOB|nr:L-threonylcarbamoyladenylate synthase [Puniceibacterium sediminis]SNR70149.1 L-threonylcarbamoyladenylate synthase [Puniceibacterium sediminis]